MAMIRKTMVIILAAAAAMMLYQGSCNAEKISKYFDEWQSTDVQGQISYLSPKEDYIVVSEKKIYMVDLLHQGKRYRTSITDDSGRKMNFSDLRIGSWVNVWCGVLKDKNVAARAVIVCSRESSLRGKDFNNLKKYLPWGE